MTGAMLPTGKGDPAQVSCTKANERPFRAWVKVGPKVMALPIYACSQTELLLGPVPGNPTGTKYLKLVAGWDNSLVTIYQTALTHV